jgi:hypothetical protein
MRILHFVATATSDEVFVDSAQVTAIKVTHANTIIVYYNGTGSMGTAGVNVGFDTTTITATAKSEVVALRLAEYIAATNVGGPSVLTVAASTAPFAEVSACVNAAVA